MIKHDDKLKWLSGRLSELNDHKETVEGEIEATTDVLAEKKLEKRLGIIFEKIEHIKNEIQQEQNNLNSKLVQKKFEDLIAILQSNESLWEQIQQAYQNTRSHWAVGVKQNVDDVQSIVNELNKISQGSLTYSALDEFIANLFHKTQIEDLLKESYLGDLPTKVKEQRYETRNSKNTEVKHIGHHLSLLWDDPHFYPPKSA